MKSGALYLHIVNAVCCKMLAFFIVTNNGLCLVKLIYYNRSYKNQDNQIKIVISDTKAMGFIARP